MSLIWVHDYTINKLGPSAVALMVAGKFTGVVAYASEANMVLLARECQAAGLQCWSWVGATYWGAAETALGKDHWRYSFHHPQKLPPGTGKDLIYIGDKLGSERAQVIDYVLDKSTRLINKYPDLFTGLMWDYVRCYQEFEDWANGVHRPRTDMRPAHVDELVERVRDQLHPNALLSASVMKYKNFGYSTPIPACRVYHQNWPEWLEDGLLEEVWIMAYDYPDQLQYYVGPAWTRAKQRLIIAPGGGSGINNAPLTTAEILDAFAESARLGCQVPGAFSLGNMLDGTIDRWPDIQPPMPPEPPPQLLHEHTMGRIKVQYWLED